MGGSRPPPPYPFPSIPNATTCYSGDSKTIRLLYYLRSYRKEFAVRSSFCPYNPISRINAVGSATHPFYPRCTRVGCSDVFRARVLINLASYVPTYASRSPMVLTRRGSKKAICERPHSPTADYVSASRHSTIDSMMY